MTKESDKSTQPTGQRNSVDFQPAMLLAQNITHEHASNNVILLDAHGLVHKEEVAFKFTVDFTPVKIRTLKLKPGLQTHYMAATEFTLSIEACAGIFTKASPIEHIQIAVKVDETNTGGATVSVGTNPKLDVSQTHGYKSSFEYKIGEAFLSISPLGRNRLMWKYKYPKGAKAVCNYPWSYLSLLADCKYEKLPMHGTAHLSPDKISIFNHNHEELAKNTVIGYMFTLWKNAQVNKKGHKFEYSTLEESV